MTAADRVLLLDAALVIEDAEALVRLGGRLMADKQSEDAYMAKARPWYELSGIIKARLRDASSGADR